MIEECLICGALRQRGPRRRLRQPCRHPWVDDSTTYERDPICQALVTAHPGGMSLKEIGEVMGGLTRERIRQVEALALAKVALAIDRLDAEEAAA